MNKKRLKAFYALNDMRRKMRRTEMSVEKRMKEILAPCGEHGCLVGTEDYADDLFYVYAEPRPNKFRRVTGIRYLAREDFLEVRIVLDAKEEAGVFNTDEDGWMSFARANVTDIRFLLDEIIHNLEYSDGYCDE